MKKLFKYFVYAWLVSLICFNAITFIVPNEIMGITRFDKSVFWIAYVFVLLSFAAQLILIYKCAHDKANEALFLSIPIIRLGYIALLICLAVGCIFMTIPVLPTWLGAIICLIITGILSIAIISNSATKAIVTTVENKIEKNTVFMRLAIAEAEAILSYSNADTKIFAQNVYDALRYSDTVSSSTLEEIEKQIEETLKSFKMAIISSTVSDCEKLSNKIVLLVKERSIKCRLLKG